jgi:hypothetical protein
MGAALLPAIISPLIGAAVSSIVAPAPKQTIIAPPQIQPSLSSSAASQIAANTQSLGQQFGNTMLNGIISRARAQGVDNKTLGAITNNFNTWFSQNQSSINSALATKANYSQNMANYQNAIQTNNFNTQLAAMNANQPSSMAGLGGIFGKAASSLLGGAGGGVPPATFTDTGTISGYDDVGAYG